MRTRQKQSTRLALCVALILVAACQWTAVAQAATGTWERAWGKDVVTGGTTGFEICTVAANCKRGDFAGIGGELYRPRGAAVDSAGRIWVADTWNYRLQVFDSSGAFQFAFGMDVVNGGGTGLETCTVAANCKEGIQAGGIGGALLFPTSVAFDSAGNVYVLEDSGERISKFTSSLSFERTWGSDVDAVAPPDDGPEICTVSANCKPGESTGSEVGGTFSFNGDAPGLAVDPATGNVYTADRDRVQVFEPDGDFIAAWGKDVVTGGGTGTEICTVAADCNGGIGSGGGLGGEFYSPNGVSIRGGTIAVADSFNQRVHELSLTGSFERAWGKDVVTGGGTGFEICTVASACKKGLETAGIGGGSAGGEFDDPEGVAFDTAGSVYVSDTDNNRTQKFDSSGNFLATWGKDVDIGGGTGFEICTVAASCKMGVIGVSGGELEAPGGLATNSAGDLFVADSQNHRIQRFSDDSATSPPPPADTDGDGIADSSDACPTQVGPASNNGCPVVSTPPPSPGGDDAACQAAKDKVAKAKKKLKKLKQQDAAAEKIKKAKKKLKRAKQAAQEAC